MRRQLLFLLSFVLITGASFAQSIQVLEGTYLSSMSDNGKYALGYSEGDSWAEPVVPATVSIYDIANNEMNVYTMETGTVPYLDFISDTGVAVGNVNDKTASFFKDGVFYSLSLPNVAGINSSAARGISSDASVICGYYDLGLDNGGRRPILWTLKDGSYTVEELPAPTKDFMGKEPQAVDALRVSAAGDAVLGRIIDWTGIYNMVIAWKKNTSGAWEYTIYGEELVYNADVKLPEISFDPFLYYPNEPDVYSYLTEDEITKLNDDINEYYANGEVGTNPWDNKAEYISDPDKKAEYEALYAEYEILFAEYEHFWDVFDNQFLTGKAIDVTYINFGFNGRYATATSEIKGASPFEPAMHSPMYFDLETGESVIYEKETDALTYGITNNGDLFYSNPYMERTRSSFVLPAGKDSPLSMGAWIRELTDNKLSIADYLYFGWQESVYAGYDEEKGEIIWDYVDQAAFLSGSVIPSADGKVFLGFFIHDYVGAYTYIVDLDGPLSIDTPESTTDAIQIYPNPTSDFIKISDNYAKAQLMSLSGQVVAIGTGGDIAVGSLPAGIYVLEVVTSDNKTLTKKIIVQ